MKKYPCLEIDLKKLSSNIKNVLEQANKKDIDITGVIKGVNGDKKIIECFITSGIKTIASSRYEHLKTVKEIDKNISTMLIRIPLISEIEEIIKYSDISLNSEIEVIKQLNKEAKKQGKIHKVILMVDLGDLREGYFDYNELINDAIKIEKLKNIHLLGIGTNLGCYGAIKPTIKNLNILGDLKEKIESKINRKLEVISGGASSSYALILNNEMPKCINNLRIGEHILNKSLLPHNVEDKNIFDDAFILKTQIIEKKIKPTLPIGEKFIDAFGNTPVYEDLGNKIRILLGIGKLDIYEFDKIKPLDKDIKLIGASSDHLIAITDNNKYKIGDILSFKVTYQSLLFLTESPYVIKKYKE